MVLRQMISALERNFVRSVESVIQVAERCGGTQAPRTVEEHLSELNQTMNRVVDIMEGILDVVRFQMSDSPNCLRIGHANNHA